jgi:hypothetical protein
MNVWHFNSQPLCEVALETMITILVPFGNKMLEFMFMFTCVHLQTWFLFKLGFGQILWR